VHAGISTNALGGLELSWQSVGRDLLPPILARVLARVRSRVLGYSTRPLPPVVSDDLTIWMRFITPGWLQQGNLEAFAYCLARLPSDAPIIEIGSFAGLSLNHLIFLLRRANRQNPVDRYLELGGFIVFDDSADDGPHVGLNSYR
jgi:hypothetical protein